MKKNFTPGNSVSQNLKFFLTFFEGRILVFFMSSILLLSCTKDEIEDLNLETTPPVEANKETHLYKGVFASQHSGNRGTIEIHLTRDEKNSEEILEGNALLTLHTGETYKANLTSNKSTNKMAEDFKVFFYSQDMEFSFYLDENDVPIVADVVINDQSGSVVVAEHTADSPVTPVTGVYRCTNCENQTSTLDGIPLNNNDRVFNMLLTTKDGQTGLTIQAVLGSLINAQLVVEEACTTDGRYTFCTLKGGANATTEPVQWSGIHRYTTDATEADACSTLWGNLTFNSPNNGVIEAEFISDNTCSNNTYYVSAAGDDNNSGLTPNDAWKTIQKVNSITVKPGDAVLFEGGKTFNGSLKFDSNDANGGSNAVTVSSYGTGRATISSGTAHGIDIYNTAGFKINNLIVSGTPGEKNSGIQFYTDLDGDVKFDFAEVKNVEVHGFSDFGIVFGSWKYQSVNNSGFKNVVVENARVYDIMNVGIGSYGNFSASKTGYAHSNIVVRKCEVFNITGNPAITEKHTGNGIMLSDVQNSVIEYSTAYNSGQLNANSNGGPVGIWYWDADNVTIQYNEVYGMKSGTKKDGGGFDLDGGVTNGTMQYNYSHNNYGAGYLIGQFGGARPMRNIKVRYNVSENDAATNGGSIYLFNGASPASMKDIFVYNNTLYIEEKASNTATAAIKLLKWQTMSENINFHNNILVAENGADLVQVPSGYHANFFGNLYHTSGTFNISYKGISYGSLASFRTTQNEIYNGNEAGIEADPLLQAPGEGGTIGFGNSLTNLSAYKLQTNSPAIDAGISFSEESVENDFYGNNLSTNSIPEVGAHGNLSTGAVASN
ncbi:hypothetical protein SAMN06296241_0378 [Salinimicrobium sediminis]|uniref:Right handed beta helix region n=2 Tax=Salinimicrobium sediminis TaxID=1343891 RepID=A0A285X3A8_9FLAO|nr:hypothetical protein SAMN06296241_0378 [Salinimicrobium sediminis]